MSILRAINPSVPSSCSISFAILVIRPVLLLLEMKPFKTLDLGSGLMQLAFLGSGWMQLAP
jgi:hypothetical protein